MSFANVNQRKPSDSNNLSRESKLSPVGFRVNDETKAMLQDYANKLSNEYLMDPNTGQAIIDPQTRQPKKILEKPSIGLLVKEATFAYLKEMIIFWI
jgi:hypothetical protein